MSASNILTLTRDDGSPVQYRPVSARLPEFLAAFPPRDYAIRTDPKRDFLGEPGYIVFEAKLVHLESGMVVSNAHARASCTAYKDLESLETAAVQRLMARMGYGGDVLDVDESIDMAKQDLRGGPTPRPYRSEERIAPSVPAPEPGAGFPETPDEPFEHSEEESSESTDPETPETRHESVQDSESEGEPEPNPKPEKVEGSTGKPEKASAEESDTPKGGKGRSSKGRRVSKAKQLDSLKRQLKNVARMAGVEAPEVSTVEEAREAIRKIREARKGGAT
ncbi:hypothetical protein TK90_2869 (plasmid) [Thioalkalivibrio sp. K90mix]|uniref:hypothetical protein n=1 Tax=Thioalkalivibrio sp. (strain K90mix) TaxID=396595 RepID=UPI000195A945|nr:hypothetical protein [Thioalkalivibrio sp. K90mix]ADC73353.1 hypothetical protein TK90_2869 [Thioalkalivibrio sp. K90mix]